jgi:hypothetical protein
LLVKTWMSGNEFVLRQTKGCRTPTKEKS